MSEVAGNKVSNEIGLISYQKKGRGEKVLITFHGYGQHSGFLAPLDVLSDNYTIYHFDLPYHGNSRWHSSLILPKDFIELFTQFLKQEKIDRFAMAAFSLGGKVLLTILDSMAERIDKVILIAPDGIKVTMWYKLATGMVVFRGLFRSMVDRPDPYFRITRLLQRLGLMEKSLVKFIKIHMDTQEKREHVYQVWNSYRLLGPSERVTIDRMNQHSIPVLLYLGDYDRVIPKSRFTGFIKRLSSLQNFEIQSGHNDLVKEVSKRIANDLD